MKTCLVFRERSSDKNPAYPWYAKDYITDDCRALDPLARGLYRDLLDHSWINYGFPADEDFIRDLFKNALGVSKYKFKKIWPQLKNFFTEIEGRYYHEKQEELRRKEDQFRAKQKKNGQKGNIVRWSRQRDLRLEPEQESYPQTIPTATVWGSPNDPLPPPLPSPGNTETNVTPPPPPPPDSRQEGEEASPVSSNPPPRNGEPGIKPEESTPRDTGPPDKALTADEYRQFCEHCATVQGLDHSRGVSIPSRDLCRRIKKKFQGLPVPEILRRLPKFQNQNSPGLWDSISRENLELEALRQQTDRENPVVVPPKPTQAELAVNQWLAIRRAKEGNE